MRTGLKLGVVVIGIGLMVCGCCKKKPEASAGGIAEDSVGVAECDECLKKMEACLEKMPASGREITKASYRQSREAWKAAAKTEQGRQALKTACKAQLSSLASNPVCK